MVVQVVHGSGYICYACSIDVTGAFRNEGMMMSAFHIYERAVEYIEGLPPGATFSRVTVWRALGRGIKDYNLITHVIRDMYFHGITECVQPSGRSCLKYRVKKTN